ncbi:MAG: WD-repeat protein [Myxococcales bacterium]|nr:WD-repeat protein [Myxococcales bacterium]
MGRARKRNDGSQTLPARQLGTALERTMTSTEDAYVPGTRLPEPASGETRYVVQGEFARGGLGRVLTAHDERLDRPVAIKELLSSAHGAVHLRRFQREAAMTARLQHPAIVPVYDAGVRPDGQPYYVMKLLSSGRTLKQAVSEAATLDARLALLPNVIAVADAIAYAHSVGIIHRDIKPSNVILGPFGETVVIDWGLAKDLSQVDHTDERDSSPYRVLAADVTTAGAVVGTPHYMAPEQARGETVDKRADVYSLGALLYHVLAGVTPFEGDSATDVLKSVLAGGARPLRRRQPSIPADLAAIVDKAMQRDPALRYPSAQDLADDLKRFQTGRLVRALKYSSRALLVRWLKKHRLPASVAAVFLVILTVTIGASVRRINRERSVAVAERNRLILAQAASALDSDPTLAVEWLKTYPADGADWTRAQQIAADAASRGVARHLLPTMSQAIAVFPDGRRIVTGGPQRLVRIWDVATGALVQSATFEGQVTSVRIAPDGATVAVSESTGEIVLWNVGADTRRVLGKHDSGAFRIAFSGDGRLVASASLDVVAVWNSSTGRQEYKRHSDQAVTIIGFSPIADSVVFGTADGTLNAWELASGTVRRLVGHTGGISSVTFSRDGRQILTGGHDHTVRLWDTASGKGRILGAHDDMVRSVAFSPNQLLAASGGVDKKVRLWSLDGSAPPRIWTGHEDTINDVKFSPDGRTLASCSTDRQVRLWDVASGDERVLHGHRGDLGDVVYTPDGKTLTSTGYDEHTRIWSVADAPSTILGRHRFEAVHTVFSPTGAWAASDGSDRTARLWEVATGKERLLPGAEYSAMRAAAGVAFSADGRILAAAGDNAAHTWNLATGETHTYTAAGGVLFKVVLSADGAIVATAGSDGKIRAWDVATSKETVLAGHTSEVTLIRFAPAARVLASAGLDHTVRLWDLATGTSRVLGALGAAPTQLAFSADGRTVAGADFEGGIVLWDLASGAARALRGHTNSVSGLAFSSDGTRLASASWDHTARVWDLKSGNALLLRGHAEALRAVAFSPDGKRVATASNDRTIQLWDLATGALAVLRGHSAAVRSVDFSHDGAQLVSASEDGTVRLWRTSRVRLVPRDRVELTAWLEHETSATLSASETGNATATKTVQGGRP